MSEARRLLVLRHGITAHNAAGVWQGHTDTQLSDAGLEQARVCAGELAARGDVTRIVSSDLARARVTAETVGRACGVPVATDARLREINVGSWTGKTQAEVEQRHPDLLEKMAAGDDFARGGDGESVAQMLRRVRACADELLAVLAPGETALVVTHGVAGAALVADLVGLDPRDMWLRMGDLGNCRWAEVGDGHGAWRIDGWNHGSAPSGPSLASR